MAGKSQYIIRKQKVPGAYSFKAIVSKFDQDLNSQGAYAITGPNEEDRQAWTCNCPARKPDCRHKIMLGAFLDRPPSSIVTDGGKYIPLIQFDAPKNADVEISYVRGPREETE